MANGKKRGPGGGGFSGGFNPKGCKSKGHCTSAYGGTSHKKTKKRRKRKIKRK